MKHSILYIAVALGLSSYTIAQNLGAGEGILPEVANQNSTTLAPIVVFGGSFAQQMGTQKLNSLEISRLPTKNGTVSDLLKSNPNVRFQDFADVSETQGEIAPENVSFHGERFYNNAWLIDGLSNNDNIHPGSKNGRTYSHPDGQSPGELPGGETQSFWINSDVIDSVTVYDSNISAKYGQFTGGVIDAKLKDAYMDKSSGSISYRTTRDAWTKFHIYGETPEEQKENQAEFENAGKLYYQPQFIKHNYAFNINQPLSDSTALMFSYNLKGSHETDSGDTYNLTLMYSPHSQKYFRNTGARDSFTNVGGGYRVALDWKHLFDLGTLKSSISWKKSGNKIEHEDNNWLSYCPSGKFRKLVRRGRVRYICSGNPRFGYDGGFGQFSTEKETLTLKQDLNLDTLKTGNIEHNISAGWKMDFANAKYNRKQQITMYTSPNPTLGIKCKNGDPSCSDSQFSLMRNEYPALKTDVGNNHYSFYIEDNIKWKNLELTPGVRVDYDQYLKNTDIAPRFTASYDVFGNKKTRIFGGINRYYADSMMRYALSDNLANMDMYRRKAANEDWTLNRSVVGRRYSGGKKVKTPYSDESSIGFTQRIANTEWTAKWVHRNSKEQFSQRYEKNKKTREQWFYLENNGSSQADSYTLTGRLIKPIETQFANISFDLGASYHKSKSNFDYDNGISADYDDQITADDDNEHIIFDGKLIKQKDMPALNFNQPWNAFANINLDFPKIYLNWANRLNYTAGYEAYTRFYCAYRAPKDCGEYVGEQIYGYKKTKFKNKFTLDWNISFKPPVGKGHLEIDLDVLNVLDTRSESTSADVSSITYKAGRQFWLGAKYSW